MNKNVGQLDRIFRALAAVAMMIASVFAPLPLPVRVLALGVMGAYMMFPALAGTCLGYRLMGYSSCPVKAKAAS